MCCVLLKINIIHRLGKCIVKTWNHVIYALWIVDLHVSLIFNNEC